MVHLRLSRMVMDTKKCTLEMVKEMLSILREVFKMDIDVRVLSGVDERKLIGKGVTACDSDEKEVRFMASYLYDAKPLGVLAEILASKSAEKFDFNPGGTVNPFWLAVAMKDRPSFIKNIDMPTKICVLTGLNHHQLKDVFEGWSPGGKLKSNMPPLSELDVKWRNARIALGMADLERNCGKNNVPVLSDGPTN